MWSRRRFWLPVLGVAAIVFSTYWLSLSQPAQQFITRFAANNPFLLESPKTIYGVNIPALIASLCILLGALLYLWIDYTIFKAPLVAENPTIRYTMQHHLWVVTLPKIKHRRPVIEYWSSMFISMTMALIISTIFTIQLVRAAAPTVTTGSATEITQTSVRLSGNVTSQGTQTLTVRGFEYGPTVSYGDVVSDTKPDTYQFASSIGTQGSGNGQFSQPAGIAKDSNGNIYVVDYANHRIQKFNANGVYQSQWGCYLLDIFTCTNDDYKLNFPQGIAIDENDMIYVTDTSSSRIRKYNTAGVH